jgi:hypothetical protein
MSVTVVHAAEDDMGSGGDAGGDLASATLFTVNKGNGFCSSTNDWDYYKFPDPNETPDYMGWEATKDGFFYISVQMRTGTSATYTIEITSRGSEEESGGVLGIIDSLGIPGFTIPTIITAIGLATGVMRKRRG